MARREFPTKVKREARRRSGGRCEAVGTDYNLPAGQRCNGNLSKGVQFDHINPDGLTGEPTLENCAAVCRKCHQIKTSTVDVPRIAQAKRREDKIRYGIRKPTHPNFKAPPGTHFDWKLGRRVKDNAR